jgi:cytochrome c oxidase cbb3-type subunit I/II
VAVDSLMAQANLIAEDLRKGGIPIESDREIIALIAYLQRLGTDIKKKPATIAGTNP